MRPAAPRIAAAVAALLGAALTPSGLRAQAELPGIVNARIETRPLAGSLEQTVNGLLSAQAGPFWIAYALPSDREHRMCCWSGGRTKDGSCAGCRLEDGDDERSFRTSPGAVTLAGPPRIRVLLRGQDRRIDRIKLFSEDCALDLGGLPFVWVESVTPAESARHFASLAAGPHPKLREQVLFALSQVDDPLAADKLIDLARRDPEDKVRGQALFWLSQVASRKAVAAIEAAVDQDPEEEIKKKAVFAVSQLPRDESVPLLTKLARTHPNREVRKQAIFWLGQSGDPRALAFFEELLKP
jgi:hypothetical protein